MQTTPQSENQQTPGRTWVAPTLNARGTVQDVVRGGGGKLSIAGGDPGEHKKQKPDGPA
jgi:hypothetical protein